MASSSKAARESIRLEDNTPRPNPNATQFSSSKDGMETPSPHADLVLRSETARARRQRITKPPLWPATLPYNYFNPSIPSFSLPIMSYVDKLDSPIITILVGPEKTPLKAHKAMLTEAGEQFSKWFGGKTQAVAGNKIELLEDDCDAWELLIEWCYKGELPTREQPDREAVINDHGDICWNRLKLCCLAEKYDMKLLHNTTIDWVVWYLSQGAPGPKVKWDIFRKWCVYIHKSTTKSPGIWDLMCHYYFYTLVIPKSGTGPNKVEYNVDEMALLAEEIADLTKYIIRSTREHFLEDRNKAKSHEPWDRQPCTYHLHSKAAETPEETEVLECPFDVARHGLAPEWQYSSSRVAYFLQTSILRGHPVCYTSQVVRDMGMSTAEVKKAVGWLIHNKIVVWVIPNESFTLRPLKLQ